MDNLVCVASPKPCSAVESLSMGCAGQYQRIFQMRLQVISLLPDLGARQVGAAAPGFP